MPKSPPSIASNEATHVAAEEARSAMERVASSQSFQRAERLRSLFCYICEASLRGDGSQVNEYMIGLEVFRRGPDYSPSEDAIVRRMAHALRQKLDKYYASEGAADPIRIELRPGHYVAQFHRQAEAETVAPEPVAVATSVPIAAPSPIRPAAVWIIVGACALLGAGVLIGRLWPGRSASNPTDVPPAAAALWGSWLHDSVGATLCFSNPMAMSVRQLTEPEGANQFPMTESRFLEVFSRNFDVSKGGKLYWAPDQGQGKLGEAIAAVTLAGFLSRAGIPVRATNERAIDWDDFRRENMVVFGHQEINRFVEPLLDRYPLRQDGTYKRIVNRSPRAGEQAEYELQRLNSAGHPVENYALISMIPGMDSHRRLLLITGLESPAAALATEYLTDPAKSTELLQRLHAAAGPGKEIRFFQALLKGYIRGRVPTEGSIVIVRTL
jgi:hypothetical protein